MRRPRFFYKKNDGFNIGLARAIVLSKLKNLSDLILSVGIFYRFV